MEKNNEIVVTANNTEGYDFNRVNFDDPSTIVNYGVEVLNEMSEQAKIHAQMLESQGASEKLDDEIKIISRFSEQLKRGSSRKGIKGLITGGINGVKSLVKSGKVETDVNFIKYQDYCENLKRIATNIEEEKFKTLKEIGLNSDFIKKMNPLIAKLELLVNVGYSDLEAFRVGVFTSLEEQYNANPENVDIRREYLMKKQSIDVFEGQLADLNKSLVTYKETLLEMDMAQGPNMELVISYNSYLKTTAPNLDMQATSMVNLQRQRERIDKHQSLLEAVNATYVKNAEMLVENIQDAVTLSENGNITMDTIRQVDALIDKGVNLLIDSAGKKQQRRQDEIIALQELSDKVEVYKGQIGNYILGEKAAVEALNGAPKTKSRRLTRGK